MLITVKSFIIITHFLYTPKMGKLFDNEIGLEGLIAPPHFAINVAYSPSKGRYASFEGFVGEDSIGSRTAGFGASYGVLWDNRFVDFKLGGILGGYYNDNKKWGSMNDSVTIDFSDLHSVAPLIGFEAVVEGKFGNYSVVFNNRIFPTITTHTLCLGYNF